MAATLHLRDRFKEHWDELKRGRPGRRFQERYERAHDGSRDGHTVERIVLSVVAVICVAIGVVLAVMPGPAVLFFALAGGLLATESRAVARMMDWSEVRLRKLIAWAKRRRKDASS